MNSLYQLTAERLSLQTKLQELNFDEQTIADTLEGESAALEIKIENYGFVIRNMEAFGDAIKAEETRLSERRKAHEKRIQAIKDWLHQNMIACGITKIECPAFTIAVQNNPSSVNVFDEEAIPEEFLRQPETPPPAPDKKAIMAAIKSGQTVPGCEVKQATRLVIK